MFSRVILAGALLVPAIYGESAAMLLNVATGRSFSAPDMPVTYRMKINGPKPVLISSIHAEIGAASGQIPTVTLRRLGEASTSRVLQVQRMETKSRMWGFRIDEPVSLSANPGDVFLVEVHRFHGTSGPLEVNRISFGIQQ
jgi:hypothetical protein